MTCWFRRAPAKLAGAIATLLLAAGSFQADAKSPGGSFCYGGVCHRVMTLAETEAQIGKVVRLNASHYDGCEQDRHNACGLTSSGEVFRPNEANNAASSVHPDGTVLLLRNPAGGLTAVVRINNFGPFRGNRRIDVS